VGTGFVIVTEGGGVEGDVDASVHAEVVEDGEAG
jgi:hypothetical protein